MKIYHMFCFDSKYKTRYSPGNIPCKVSNSTVEGGGRWGRGGGGGIAFSSLHLKMLQIDLDAYDSKTINAQER